MTVLRVDIIGIGAWAVGLEGWPAMRAALRDGAIGSAPAATAAARPSPALLPAAERRRAPEGVAVALEVAREAVDMAIVLDAAGHTIDKSSLASVFASAHGDLAIVDYLCATLAGDPTLLSPTRFHHSVHNSAAGYWSIATHGTGPASAIAAGEETFAAGLLEAATQACAEARPVLLVAFDTPAVGPLVMAAPNTALFGIAMVLTPSKHFARSTLAQLTAEIRSGASAPPPPRGSRLRSLAASSASARALALAEAIACARDEEIVYPLNGTGSSLAIGVLASANAVQTRPGITTQQ